MAKILVSGLTNIETTLKIGGFPLEYNPVNYPFFGVASTVSGVGVNLSRALATLGDEVNFVTILGRNTMSELVLAAFAEYGIDVGYVYRGVEQTAQSVILYDASGRRQIHTDLKDIQETRYPEDLFLKALKESSTAALCNINFSRPYLKIAREAGITVATDVHVLKDINDDYNRDFMQYANILFMSDEGISGSPEEFAKKILDKYDNDILVIGLGNKGALLYVKKDRFTGRFNAVKTRNIINTIGAGDSLFSCFLHYYNKTGDPYISLRKAIVFASWKIGEKGSAEGFLNEGALEDLYARFNDKL